MSTMKESQGQPEEDQGQRKEGQDQYEEGQYEEDKEIESIETWKICKVLFITVLHFPRQLCTEMVGPSLPYLIDRLNVSFADGSQILVMQSMGKLVGSLTGGLLAEAFPRHTDVLFLICCLSMGLSTIAIPWFNTLRLTIIMFALQGFSYGNTQAGFKAYVLATYGKKVGPVIAFMYAFTTVGNMIVPQMVSAYTMSTSVPIDTTDIMAENVTSSINQTWVLSITNTSMIQETETYTTVPLEYPFGIAGGIMMFLSAGFAVFQWYSAHDRCNSREQPSLTFRQIVAQFSPRMLTHGRPVFGIPFLLSLSFIYFHSYGVESSLGHYIYSYALEGKPQFTPTEAANINTGYFVCELAGRALTILTSAFCPLPILIILELVTNTISGLALQLWGSQNRFVFYIFLCSYGASISSFLILGLIWANLSMKVGPAAMSIVFVFYYGGSAFYNWLAGYLFDFYGPESLFSVLLGASLFISVQFVVILILGIKYGKNEIESYNRLE